MKNRRKLALLCVLLGCLCYGGGDWLMMYGDPTHAGGLAFGGGQNDSENSKVQNAAESFSDASDEKDNGGDT